MSFVIASNGGGGPELATVGFVSTEANVFRNGNNVNILIEIDIPQVDGPVTVNYSISGSSTASNPGDYTVVTPSPVTIPQSSAGGVITLNIVDLVAADETIILTIDSVSGGNGNLQVDGDFDTHTITLKAQDVSASTVEQPLKASWGSNDRMVSLCTGISPVRVSELPSANLNGRTCDVIPFRYAPGGTGDDHSDPFVTAIELVGKALNSETDADFQLGAGTAPAAFSVTSLSRLNSLTMIVDINGGVGLIEVPVFDTSHPHCHLVETRKDGSFVKEKIYFSTFTTTVGTEVIHFGGVTTTVQYFSGLEECYKVTVDYENSVYDPFSPEGHHAPHSNQAGSFAIRSLRYKLTASGPIASDQFRVLSDHADQYWNPSTSSGSPRDLNGFHLVVNDSNRYQPIAKKCGIPSRRFVIYEKTVAWDDAKVIFDEAQYSRCYNGIFNQSTHRWYGTLNTPLPNIDSNLNFQGNIGRSGLETYFGGKLTEGLSYISSGVRNSASISSMALYKARRGYMTVCGDAESYAPGRSWIALNVGECNVLNEIKYHRTIAQYSHMRNCLGFYSPDGKIVNEKILIDTENNAGKTPWSTNEIVWMPKNNPHFQDIQDTNPFDRRYSRTGSPWNQLPLEDTDDPSNYVMGLRSVNPMYYYSQMPGYDCDHLSRIYMHLIPDAFLLNDGWAIRKLQLIFHLVQNKLNINHATDVFYQYGYQRSNLAQVVANTKNMTVFLGPSGPTVNGETFLVDKGWGWNGPPTAEGRTLYRGDGHIAAALSFSCLIKDSTWRQFNYEQYAVKYKEFLDWFTPETGLYGHRTRWNPSDLSGLGNYFIDGWGTHDIANQRGRISRSATAGQMYFSSIMHQGLACADQSLGLSQRLISGPSNASSNEPDPVKRATLIAPHLCWKVMENHVDYTPGMFPPALVFGSYDNPGGFPEGGAGLAHNPNPTIAGYEPWKLDPNRSDPLIGSRTEVWTDKERGSLMAFLCKYPGSGYSTTMRDEVFSYISAMYGISLSSTPQQIFDAIQGSQASNVDGATGIFGFWDACGFLGLLQIYLNGDA